MADEPKDINLTEISEEHEDELFRDWLDVGVAAGWISFPDCSTHNAIPLRPWEDTEFEEGGDPCIVVARVWRDGYQHVADELAAEQ